MARMSSFNSGHNRMAAVCAVLLLSHMAWTAPLGYEHTASAISMTTILGETHSADQVTISPVRHFDPSMVTSRPPIETPVTTSGTADTTSRTLSYHTDAGIRSSDSLPPLADNHSTGSSDAEDIDLKMGVSMTDLLSAGKTCIRLMNYTVQQTEKAFKQLCSEAWCSSQSFADVETCQTEVKQMSMNLPSIPTMDDAMDVNAKKTIYAVLLAVYNVSYQYAVGVRTAVNVDLAAVRGDDVSYNADCSMPTVPNELTSHCALLGVSLAFDDVVNHLRQMITSLHGQYQEPTVIISLATPERFLLAAAESQMAEAVALMTQSVLTQL